MSFSPPNYTQTPNELFALQKLMKEAELRVTLVIVRETFGWNLGGHAAALSLQNLMTETGMSKQGVLNGVEAGRQRGTIRTVKVGKEVYYGLSVKDVVVPQEGQLSRPKTVNLVDSDGQLSRPIAKPKGQRSGPKRSTRLTQTVNEVDPDGQLSRPTTPVFVRPEGRISASKDNERQERQERQDVVYGETEVFEEEIFDPETASSTQAPVQDFQGPSDASETDTTGTQDVPPAAAPLDALREAFSPWSADKLIAERTARQGERGWQSLTPERIWELRQVAFEKHGNRYRGDLCALLDTEITKNQPANGTDAAEKDWLA